MDTIVSTVNAESGLDKLIQYVKTPVFWISIIIVAAAVVLWKVLKKAGRSWRAKNNGMTTASNVAFDTVRVVFVLVVVVVLLQLNGINVTSLITGLGLVSVIIGLALQDFLKDIIMGVHILIDRFYGVGDVVRYNDIEGEVVSFNIRTTKIKKLPYGEIMTISNRNISEIMILTDMFDLDIGIPYYIDAAQVHEAMKEIEQKAANVENITRTQYKGTERFDESAIVYRMRYWTSPKSTRYDARRGVVAIVQDVLHERGIPFAYSHIEVELTDNGAADTVKPDKIQTIR